MAKNIHEIRDPIHAFVRLDSDEREVLDSRPFQRLRHIHQLGLTYLLYPAATHKRFEHSLGVMELASRVFDVVTTPGNVTDEIRRRLPQLEREDERRYWRRIIRMAALCHDVGHLPFSHAAETTLLPEDWCHERLTREIILSDEMESIWKNITPPLRSEDIVKLAIGPKEAPDLKFSEWETILAEIIVGDAFGVDRMDYLLRDSHHLGVAYGRFDHYRLIDTLRILPSPPSGRNDEVRQTQRGTEEDGTREAEVGQEEARRVELGIEEGGVHSAEALLLARYFMYTQVYFHPVRRVYDIHLQDFLKAWLSDGLFSTELEQHLKMTDNEITAALLEAAFDASKAGHEHARRITQRQHFKVIYQRNPNDVNINLEAGSAVYRALTSRFGEEHFRRDRYV